MKTKRTLIILFFSFLMARSMAQSIVFQPSNEKTYHIETKIKQRGIKKSAELINLTSKQVERDITYFDDAERPIQLISWQSSPEYKDFVVPKLYDLHSREAQRYELYPDVSYNGEYHTYNSSYNNQEEFYTNPPDGVVKMPLRTAISRTLFESASVGRPIEQGAPGAEWNVGSGHTVRYEYSSNSNSEIPLWVINDDANGAELRGYYAANSLYKTTIIDENGKKRIEYKDKQGKIVCKSLQKTSASYVSTYYIFDNTGNLRYIMPPVPSEYGSIPSSFDESSTIFNALFFGYKYRGGNQVIEKKLPGMGWQTVIYNKLDQPILIQDAELKKTNRWLYTKYDALSRPIITGIYTDNVHIGQASMQSYVNSLNMPNSETFINSLLNQGYTNVSFPVEFTSAQEISYYDTYDALNNEAINNMPDVFALPSVNIDTLQRYPRGLVSAKRTKVLNTPLFLLSVNHYNTDGGIVKTINQNYRSGQTSAADFDVNEYQYTFDGLVTQILRKHYNVSATTPALTVQTNYSYDHRGRPLKSLVKYNNQAAIVLSQNEYNAIGQLKTKHIHNANTAINAPLSTYLQHIDYRYNERGWLNRINNPNNLIDENNSNQTDAFALLLFYNGNNPAAGIDNIPQYNSNISSASWSTQRGTGNSIKRSFSYSYDDINRMTLAKYNAQDEFSAYDESLSYDDLGNIKTLERKKAGAILNNLNYNYGSGTSYSNKLNAVNDLGTEDISSTYLYNENGSLISDSRKGVSEIAYNYLNLPDKIVFSSGKEFRYIYDASGQKLSRQIWQGLNLVDNRDYINGLEYNGNIIEFISNDEGRAIPSSGNYILEYALRDHLGNCRALIGDKNNNGIFESIEILQSTDYYAFGRAINYGATIVPSPDNAYKYNDKEIQPDLEQYDYGARFYDPVIGRWNAVDPLAEECESINPYNYVYNNPLSFTDPTGMSVDGWILGSDGVTMTYDARVHSQADVGKYGLGGTYKGETGYGIDGNTGMGITYNNDGTFSPITQSLNEVNVNGTRNGVGQPGLGESLIPVWGSGRAAVDNFQNGQYWTGAFNTALAVSDIFLVKSAFTAVAKLGAGLVVKTAATDAASIAVKSTYSMTSTALRSSLAERFGKRGFTEVGYQFSKHLGRENAALWEKAIGEGMVRNPGAFNRAGNKVFKEIWRSEGKFKNVNGFIEKRLSDGRGIRFQTDWKFKGFID